MSQPTRRYDSSTRRARSLATRAAILVAARRLLGERGWSGMTMRALALEAGVAEPTIYAAYGNKAGVASALVDDIASRADAGRQGADLASAAGKPSGQLAAMVGFDRRLYEYGADTLAMLRDAAVTLPDLPDAYARGRADGDRLRRELFSSWPAGTLRAELDLDAAIDVYAALCNIDVYRTLTGERGWSPDRVEAWLHDSTCRLLLAHPPRARRASA